MLPERFLLFDALQLLQNQVLLLQNGLDRQIYPPRCTRDLIPAIHIPLLRCRLLILYLVHLLRFTRHSMRYAHNLGRRGRECTSHRLPHKGTQGEDHNKEENHEETVLGMTHDIPSLRSWRKDRKRCRRDPGFPRETTRSRQSRRMWQTTRGCCRG